MPRTMECRFVQRVFVIVHGERPPTDEDWGAYLDAIPGAAEWDAQVVYSMGGNPTAAQRRTAVLKGDEVLERPVPTAILSDSITMRAITSFFNWLFPKRFKFFRPNELERAFAYLELEEEQRRAVAAALKEMKRSLGGS